MDHLWDFAIVPLLDSPVQETPEKQSETRSHEHTTPHRRPEKTTSMTTKKPTPVAKKPNLTPGDISSTTRTRVGIDGPSAQLAKTQEDASISSMSSGSATTKIVKLAVGKTNLQQFMAADSTFTTLPQEASKKAQTGQSGAEKWFTQSHGTPQFENTDEKMLMTDFLTAREEEASRKRAAPDPDHPSSHPVKKRKAAPFLTTNQRGNFEKEIESLNVAMANEPRPLTEYMSRRESCLQLLEDTLAIDDARYSSRLEESKAEIAVILRLAESMSLEHLDHLIRCERVDDFCKLLLKEVRHARRADELS